VWEQGLASRSCRWNCAQGLGRSLGMLVGIQAVLVCRPWGVVGHPANEAAPGVTGSPWGSAFQKREWASRGANGKSRPANRVPA